MVDQKYIENAGDSKLFYRGTNPVIRTLSLKLKNHFCDLGSDRRIGWSICILEKLDQTSGTLGKGYSSFTRKANINTGVRLRRIPNLASRDIVGVER